MDAPQRYAEENMAMADPTVSTLVERRVGRTARIAYQLVCHQGAIALAWIDPSCDALLQVSAAQLIADTTDAFCRCLHPDDAKELERSLHESATTYHLWQWQGRWQTAEGQQWLQTVAQPYVDDTGSLIWEGLFILVRPTTAAPLLADTPFAPPTHWQGNQALVFENLVANIPGAVYRCNCIPPWDMDYITPLVEEITGYTPAELSRGQTLTWDSITYPEDRPYVSQSVDAAIAQNTPLSLEYRIVHKDGSIRWVSERGRIVCDDRGTPLHIDGVICDISDRRANEAALQQLNTQLEALVAQRTQELITSNARLQMLLSCTPIVLFAIDMDGTLILSEGKGLETLGLKPGDVVGQSVYDLYRDYPDVLAFLRQALTNSLPEGVSASYTTRIGDLFYENHYSALLDSTGQQIGVIGISVDVTKRSQAEKALQQSQLQLTSILNNASASIYVKDLEGRYIFANREMQRAQNRTEAEILGKTDHDLFPPDLAELFVFNDRQTLTVGNAIKVEENLYVEGQTRTYLSVKFPLLDEAGQPHSICGISTDITDRKQFENDLQERDRLLNGVALATSTLLTTTDYDHAIHQALAVLGITASVDRIYVFQNSIDPDTQEPLMSQRYEWVAEGIVSELHNPLLQNLPYRELSIDWYTTLCQGQPVVGRISSFPDSVRFHLEAQQVRSLMLMPIEVEGRIWGFIGCDDCTRDRDWSSSEQSILRAAANSLGGAIARQETELQLRESQQILQLVMDTIPQVVFWKDKNSRYMGGNRNFLNIHGVESISGIYGKTDYDLYSDEEEIHRYRDTDRQVMESGQGMIHIIESGLTAEGDRLWFDNTKVPMRDERGNIIGVLGTFENITDRKLAEEALQDSRQRLSMLFEQTPVAIIEWDIDLNVREWNPAAERIFGYACEEVLGQPLGFLIPDYRRPSVREAMGQLFLCPRVLREVGENLKKDGTRVICEWYDVPLISATGDVVGIASMALDVTQRELAQEALRTSQQRLSLLIQQTPLGVIDWSPNGKVLDWNPAAERIFGYTRDEAVGRTFEFLIPEWVKDKVIRIFQTLSSDRQSNRSTNENVTKDGQVIICEWYNTPLVAPNGEMLGVVSAVMDVTERRRSEKALRRTNAMLTAQREASIDGILVLDEHRHIVSYNQRFCELWGIVPDSITDGGDRLIVQRLLEQLTNSEEFLNTVDFLYERPEQDNRNELILLDGRVLDCYSAPVRSQSGEFYGRVWYFRDITHRKQTEAQLRQQTLDLEQAILELQRTQAQLVQSEKMSSLGQLVAGVAHEINNPVNFIYGNLVHATEYIRNIVQLLNQYRLRYPTPGQDIEDQMEEMDLEFLVEDLPRLLGSMRIGAERIREIVYSLRTFSRLDEAELKAVDIHEGIDSTLLILHNRLKAKSGNHGIEVVKHYSDLPLVQCYAGQLNQVFMNILANAIDAIEEYADRHPTAYQDCLPTITITTDRIKPNWIRIRISDNGPGMPPAVQQQLFDPFFTTKPVGKGTGLGMSISHQIIVDRHRGQLLCASAPGQGTEFTIVIPEYS